MDMKRWYFHGKDLYERFNNDEVTALAAQLTYYFILAFFPFLVFVLTLAGFTPVTDNQILSKLTGMLPESSYNMLTEIINEVLSKRSETLLSIGMIATLWISSNGLYALIRGLNKAFDSKETRPFWKLRGLAVLYTTGLAITIILSFAAIIFGRTIGMYLFNIAGFSVFFKPVWNIVRYLLSLLTILIILGTLYYILPNKKLSFGQILPGAIFSTLAWIIISFIFSCYINNFSNYSNIYGSIGGIIVLLIWLYWTSIILILGGEINATLAFNKINY